MALRGARILLAGACTQAGSSLVEAFLALGAHVVATDRLRTRLEELRARMKQHERLWVADCDASDAQSALALFADVARDEPIDAALLVLAREAGAADPLRAGRVPDPARPARAFLRAALATMPRAGRGRVIALLEPPAGDAAAELAAALALDVDEVASSTGKSPLAVALAIADLEGDAWLERVVALADPAQPALRGLQGSG